jgi:hypothetical protein
MRLHELEQMRAKKIRNNAVLKHSGVEELSSTYFTRLKMPSQDATANDEISSKLACFAAALLMNALIFAGANHLFNSQIRHHTATYRLPRPMAAVPLQITPGVTIVDAERSPDRKLRWTRYPQNSRTSKFDVARIAGA